MIVEGSGLDSVGGWDFLGFLLLLLALQLVSTKVDVSVDVPKGGVSDVELICLDESA